MGFNESETVTVNGSKAYFWASDKKAENFNFYDYEPKKVERHLVIEGSVERDFKHLIKPDVKGLSIVTSENVNFRDVIELIPHVEALLVQCDSISQVEVLSQFEQLDYFSLTSNKNEVASFKLPNQLKAFVCVWKDKFKITDFSNSLEYLFLEKAKKLDFRNLINASTHLVKLELIDCNLDGCVDNILNLKSLLYLSLVKCSGFGTVSSENVNTSVRYIYLSKVKVTNTDWVQKFSKIDILILEDCGDIDTMKPLEQIRMLRGLWLAGNTKLTDGDLNWLVSLTKLENLFIRDYSHYTHRSLHSWSWKRFGSNHGLKLYDRK